MKLGYLFFTGTKEGGGLALCRAREDDFATKADTDDVIIEDNPIPKNAGYGKRVAVIGAGVGGLTAAYLLLKCGYEVDVYEAEGRVGGRSLTLRNGDKVTEVINGESYTQTACFRDEPTCERGQDKPYLNAGPGRIPSGHRNVLNLCRELGVHLEPYIKETRSNVHYSKYDHCTPNEDKLTDDERVNRRIANDTRGHIAALLYKQVKDMNEADLGGDKKSFQELLIQFGDLKEHKKEKGTYVYEGSTRCGYPELPTLEPDSENKHYEAIPLKKLLASKFWKQSFYLAEEWLWQASSFQPVGGMDQIEKELEKEITAPRSKGTIRLNSKVERIFRDSGKWKIMVSGRTLGDYDFCISNVPIPLMQNTLRLNDLDCKYQEALTRVYGAKGFLRPTTKVGWQAERSLWQHPQEKHQVPIFGGISYTADGMTQMWYPSDNMHAKYGMLTGAYNSDSPRDNDFRATEYGKMIPSERLMRAKKEAANLHNKTFADGLNPKHGVTIAWQNIESQKGGWVDWAFVEDPKESLNTLLHGSNNFYITGDQVSVLPGWKEGAIASACSVVGQITGVCDCVPITVLPDTEALTMG